MNRYNGRFLRRRKRFTGIDIGSSQIKLATVEVVGGVAEVVSLLRSPSPPDLWPEEADDENLVAVLSELAEPGCGEVITAVGKGAAKIILGGEDKPAGSSTGRPPGILTEQFSPGTGTDGPGPPAAPTMTAAVSFARGEREISIEVPSALIYRCYSIFARAGLPLQAVDLDSLALWRLLGKGSSGTAAILDLGAARHLLLIISGGCLRRAVDWIADSAREEGDLTREAVLPLRGEKKTAAQIRRWLSAYREREGEPVEEILLTGGGSNCGGLVPVLRQNGWKVSIPEPRLRWAPDLAYDPVYAVALGLALKGVMSGGG